MSKKRARNHIIYFFASIATILLSSVLLAETEHAVHLSGPMAIPVCNTCFFKEITGLSCPICGLTRSFIAIGHLKFEQAWAFHRVGFFVYFFVIIQIPYRLHIILRKEVLFYTKIIRTYGYLIIVLLLINWFYNVIGCHFS